MKQMKFAKELYSRTVLIKAAYNFTDIAFLHLDSDDKYYYVEIDFKEGKEEINEQEFVNEMLAQSVRHEVYTQTKNIRELLLARAMATSVVMNLDNEYNDDENDSVFTENEILKDWFSNDESN